VLPERVTAKYLESLGACPEDVKRFRTRVALDTLKRSMAVPVDATPG